MSYIKAPNMSIWEYDEFGNPTSEYFNPINSYQGSGLSYFNPVAVATLGRSDSVSNGLENTYYDSIQVHRLADLQGNDFISVQRFQIN